MFVYRVDTENTYAHHRRRRGDAVPLAHSCLQRGGVIGSERTVEGNMLMRGLTLVFLGSSQSYLAELHIPIRRSNKSSINGTITAHQRRSDTRTEL